MNRLAAATLLGALFTLLGGSLPACAKVFLTVDEALQLAFPECEVVRGTVFLTDEQRSAAEERSGSEIRSSLVYPYAATCGGEAAGVAYFDTHRVRTLPETIMVVIEVGGEVGRVEACEPECGCTLAQSAPNSVFARSMASVSAMSTNSQPP